MIRLLLAMVLFLTSMAVVAADQTIPTSLPELFTHYGADSPQPLDAGRGKELWFKKTLADDGKMRDCTVCHGDALNKPGKHIKTGKVIDPMAPSANKERFTDLAKVEKWFKRNCKWTLGRECTAQEKGDVLKYLSLH
jgi:hypothetical protein